MDLFCFVMGCLDLNLTYMLHTIIDIWAYLDIIMVIVLTLFALSPNTFVDIIDYSNKVYVRTHTQLVKLWQKMTKG